jgi:hypothetical protein
MSLNMLNSAEKVVLLLMAITTCICLFFRVIDSKDFMVLATMVFAFYYAKPIDENGNVKGL